MKVFAQQFALFATINSAPALSTGDGGKEILFRFFNETLEGPRGSTDGGTEGAIEKGTNGEAPFFAEVLANDGVVNRLVGLTPVLWGVEDKRC